MQTLPFISVIIAHLNQPELLRQCLRSLDQQSYSRDRYEVIVVDNGSTHPPCAVVEAFRGVRLEFESIPGPGPARNRGTAVAKGEVFAFIDSDEFADRGWLMSIGRRFAATDEAIVLGGDVRIAFRNPDHPTGQEAYESIFSYRQQEYIERLGFSGTGNLAVRRHDFETIGVFAGIDVSEDRVWGRQARQHGFRIVYVPEMVVFTPARPSFGDLCTKWDRHILHDYEEWRRSRHTQAAWIMRAGAVALSTLVHLAMVARSPRIAGPATRAKAALALARIRAYRAWQMLRLALSPAIGEQWRVWNRRTP